MLEFVLWSGQVWSKDAFRCVKLTMTLLVGIQTAFLRREEITMKIRTYLVLSYLALVLLVSVGMIVIVDLALNRASKSNLESAARAVKGLAKANYDFDGRREVFWMVSEQPIVATVTLHVVRNWVPVPPNGGR